MYYMNAEMPDIHFMYGLVDGNSSQARRLYMERFPDRDIPDRKIFQNINQTGTLKRHGDPGLPMTVRTVQLELTELDMIEEDPAKNPPPLCLPLAVPYIPASIDLCARVYDIHTPGQNLQMCFDFETRILQATVLILHFDCMRMGNDGVALVKPGDTLPFPGTTESQVGSDIYDEVTEIKYKKPNKQ